MRLTVAHAEEVSAHGASTFIVAGVEPLSRVTQNLMSSWNSLQDAEDDDVFQTVSNKMGNIGGADPVRRLSRAVLPQLPRSSLGDTVHSSGGYERRPSILVGNMLQGYGRRMSRMDNACYVSSSDELERNKMAVVHRIPTVRFRSTSLHIRHSFRRK